MHRYLLHNDSVREASEKLVSPGQVGLLAGWGVFSTVRVSKGVLFAFERHFARMQRDARLMRVPFPSDIDWLRERLLKLIEANDAQNATLRVVVVRNKGGVWEGPGIERDFDLIAFTTGLADWGDGVKLGVVPQARHAESMFAGTKIDSWAQNLCWYEEAHERGLDEVVLLNERDEVSECTSANIFISAGNLVLTPPLTSGCLPGITRELILTEIRVPGIEVRERTILLSDLEAADEVFITSTTRDLLAVASVEGLTVQRKGTARKALQTAFSQYIEDYTVAKAGLQAAPAAL
jgi:branched-chain amino acid aminotransferase